MTQAPRHLQPETTLSDSLVSALRGRPGKTLAGVALAVPTTIGSIGLAAPANANASGPHDTARTSATASATPAQAPTSSATTTRNAYQAGDVTVLSYGDNGSLVKTLQDRLNITKDGNFGPGTRASVKAFQGKKGLAQDGVVGPKTWSALGGFPGGGSGGGGNDDGGDSGNDAPASSSKAVQIASKYIGTSYRYGGGSPSEGFDCSGLTSYVFNQLGKSLPRTARAQQAAATKVGSPQPGDLVFYGYPAYHVGIYVGGGKMIDAPKPGMTVQKRDVYQPEVSSYGRF